MTVSSNFVPGRGREPSGSQARHQSSTTHTSVSRGPRAGDATPCRGVGRWAVCLNWCAPEQIAWSRERIAKGAMRAHRDPAQIQVVEYIRVCVDPDVKVARRALARSTMGYALGQWIPTARERQWGYRAHFERMGYSAVLAELDHMRQRGATRDEVADAFPPEFLQHVGYYGTRRGRDGLPTPGCRTGCRARQSGCRPPRHSIGAHSAPCLPAGAAPSSLGCLR